MAKVRAIQATIPKAVTVRYSIAPGTEIVFEPAGDVIRVVPGPPCESDLAARVALFERLVVRQRQREAAGSELRPSGGRGWTREDLYDRGRSR